MRKYLSRTALILILAAALNVCAHATTFSGLVVKISDGDTLTVVDDERRAIRVRLAGIDAPENNQSYGSVSRKHLSELIFQKRVQVTYSKTDRYGRIIGKVQMGETDISLEQINRGLAWHYKHYANEQSVIDRITYSKAELVARASRQGLWNDLNPVAPWDFRRSQ